MADEDNVDTGNGYVIPRTGPDAGVKRYKGNPKLAAHAGPITANYTEEPAVKNEDQASNAGMAAQTSDLANKF